MQELRRVIEESSLALVMADVQDLQGLARLHSNFQEMVGLLRNFEQLGAGQALAAEAAAAAAGLIEKIVLEEIQDTPACLQIVQDTFKVLHTAVESALAGTTPVISLPPALKLPGGSPAPAAAANRSPAPELALPANVDAATFKEFLAGVPENLNSLEAAIIAAEQDATTPKIAALQGLLHNLKGEAGLMGLEEIAAYIHQLENLLQEQTGSIPGEKLLKGRDKLAAMLMELAPQSKSQPPASALPEKSAPPAETTATATAPTPDQDTIKVSESDLQLIADFINESNEHLAAAEADLLGIEENPRDEEKINGVFRAFHTIKGVAGFLNLAPIGALAHATENLLDLARKGNLLLAGGAVDVVFEAVDLLKQMLAGLANGLDNRSPVAVPANLQDLITRIKACAAGEIPPARTGGANAPSDRNLEKSGENDSKNSISKVASESTVKVTTGRLDSLINMVGELVIAQLMVSQDLSEDLGRNQRLERNVRHLNKITRELQELSMSMRMVPVQGVFQKMARLVRDLSHKAGKKIDFAMSGADTELDRNVVEAIADPLVHMVRNSIDHGVEMPQDRISAGKHETGTIELRAYHEGGNIVIEIRDDGKGLNRDKILKKAMERGIVKEGQELSDADIYRLIFHAGLSTADKITDISGRGVGMDVVRKNVELLRGRIDISTTPGKGSVFSIRLPLTLAVIDGQVVRVGRERFIIPTLTIEQSLRPTPEQYKTVQGGRGEMINIRGELAPLVRLHQMFGIESSCTDPTQGLVVVVTESESRCCLLVDALLGQQQVVIKNLGDYLGTINGVSGGAIMGDGNVSLILDIAGIVKISRRETELAEAVN